jgi:glycosyltransferase involved in cell wall biosynthesis
MQQFAQLLHKVMAAAGLEVRLAGPQSIVGAMYPDELGIGKWLGYVDRFLIFPFRLRQLATWADVVHICDQSNAMYVQWVRAKPCVVTCHDMLAIRSALGEIPQNPTRWTGRIFQRRILRGLRRAQFVACVSEHTRSDVLRVAKRILSATSVVSNALNYPYCPMNPAEAIRRCGGLGLPTNRPFLLHVGGNDWYKNRQGVLGIFRNLASLPEFQSHRLAMVGSAWTNAMRTYVRDFGLSDRTHELIDVPHEDLHALYSRADALIFPSLYEGFGWPIIEAQACGCPVFTTGRPPMTDVGGKAAVYIDPSDEAAAAHAIAAGLKERNVLVSLGLVNAKRFSTERMVQGYLDAYRTVLASRSSAMDPSKTREKTRSQQ